MDADLIIRQMTQNDIEQVKQVIDLSFPKFYRFFALRSLQEEEQVLVNEEAGKVVGFAKLIEFQVGVTKLGCLLWLAVHPKFRRKRIASALVKAGTEFLNQDGAKSIFASVQRRNKASLSVFRLEDFKKMGFFDLWHIFGFKVFLFYWEIWFAPGEIVLMHD